jgi:hypothetical protein
MDLFSREDLRLLLANRQTPCVSIFMPTTRGIRLEDNKHWKNQVRQAEERLIAEGIRTSEAKDLLRPARELLDNVSFWSNTSAGVAAFLSPEMARIYRLPITLPDQVVVGHRFQVKPIVPLLSEGGRFYVLDLSQKSVRLFQGAFETMDEVSLEGIAPTNYDEAVQSDWMPEMRNFHSHPDRAGMAGAREAIFHGQGAGITSPKEGLLEFAQRVDRGLQRLLVNEQAPLVLAGVDYLLAIYRQANTYPHLLAEEIRGHSNRLTPQELHDRAWALVEPHFRKARESIADLYHQLAGTGRTTHDLAQVAIAAYQGQIQYLFVPLNQERWGRFDAAGPKVEIHERPEPGDEDLLNFAAVHTLSHKKGTVYAVQAEELPDQPLAAIFRLPIGERSSKRVVV